MVPKDVLHKWGESFRGKLDCGRVRRVLSKYRIPLAFHFSPEKVRAGLKWLPAGPFPSPSRQLTCSCWVITGSEELFGIFILRLRCGFFPYFFAKARLRCKAELMSAISYTLCAMDAINLLISRTRRGSIHSTTPQWPLRRLNPRQPPLSPGVAKNKKTNAP